MFRSLLRTLGLTTAVFRAWPERRTLPQKIKRLPRLYAFGYLLKICIELFLSHGDGLEEQRLSIHLDIQRRQLPVSRPHVLLIDKERTALV